MTAKGVEQYSKKDHRIDYLFVHKSGRQFYLGGTSLTLKECRQIKNVWQKHLEKTI